MNNNFFKNLGIGKQAIVNKWIKDNDPFDIRFKNIIYNDDLGVFRVVSCSLRVFQNMSYYFRQGKLNDHIVYDFENFSEINVKVHDDSTNTLRDKSIDEIVEFLNNMDKHIVNLKRVYIKKKEQKNTRID
jgi:ASC-1-like (ASCH) protein